MSGSERTRQSAKKSAGEGLASLAIKEFLPGIPDSIDDGLWLLDNRGCSLWIDRRQASLLGKTPGDAIGKRPWDFYPEWERGDFHEIWTSALKERRSRSFEYFCPKQRVWLEIRLHARAGGVLGVKVAKLSPGAG